MKKIYLMLTLLTSTLQLSAQNLAAGDIAFVGYQSTFPQGFSFVTLRDIPPEEVIYITDQGLKDEKGNWGDLLESHLEWTAPKQGLKKGRIVQVEHMGIQGHKSQLLATHGKIEVYGLKEWTLHIFGDQLIAYQADSVAAKNAEFMAGIHTNSIRNNEQNQWSSYYMEDLPLYSFLPSGLENGLNCISIYPKTKRHIGFNAKSNAKYVGNSLALPEINNHLNWVTSNSELAISPCDFNIFDCSKQEFGNDHLLFFEAKEREKEIKLIWVDFDPMDKLFYVVEKSIDGYTWFDKERIEGIANVDLRNCYEIYDHDPHNGLSYYRLRMLDVNGDYHFSETKPIVVHTEMN